MMDITIYQIDPDRDQNGVLFGALDQLEKWQGSPEVDAGIYGKVFEGEIDAKDLEEIDQTVRKALNFITVSHVDSVLQAALNAPVSVGEEPPRDLPQEAKLIVPQSQKKNRKPGIRQ